MSTDHPFMPCFCSLAGQGSEQEVHFRWSELLKVVSLKNSILIMIIELKNYYGIFPACFQEGL